MRIIGVRIDRRTVLVAGAVAFAFGLAANLAFALVDAIFDLSDTSNWVFAFALLAWTGSAWAGAIAGRRQRSAPLTHGALAALAGHTLNAVINVAVEAPRHTVDLGKLVVTLVLLAPIPTAIGGLAAYFTASRAAR